MNEAATDAAAALQSSISAQNAQKAQLEQKKAEIEAKLRRLRDAESQVASEKKIILDTRIGTIKKGDPDASWRGQKRDRHSDFVHGDFYAHYASYYDEASEMQDSISRKITELENEAMSTGGLLGQLGAAINSMYDQLRLLFN